MDKLSYHNLKYGAVIMMHFFLLFLMTFWTSTSSSLSEKIIDFFPIAVVQQENLPQPVPSQEEPHTPWLNNVEREIEKEPQSFQSKFLHMLFILALLVGFMLLASRMLKRMVRTRADQLNVTSMIKILETRPLSARSSLYLLDVNGQGIVIAESHTGITHIATISLENERDRKNFS